MPPLRLVHHTRVVSEDTSEIQCPVFRHICCVVFKLGQSKPVWKTVEYVRNLLHNYGALQLSKWVDTIYDSPSLTRIRDEGLWDDVNALSTIKGNIFTSKMAWYGHAVTEPGNPKYKQLYTSKTICLIRRMHHYIRRLATKDKKGCLEVYVASQPGRQSDFFIITIRDKVITDLYEAPECLRGFGILMKHYVFC